MLCYIISRGGFVFQNWWFTLTDSTHLRQHGVIPKQGHRRLVQVVRRVEVPKSITRNFNCVTGLLRISWDCFQAFALKTWLGDQASCWKNSSDFSGLASTSVCHESGFRTVFNVANSWCLICFITEKLHLFLFTGHQRLLCRKRILSIVKRYFARFRVLQTTFSLLSVACKISLVKQDSTAHWLWHHVNWWLAHEILLAVE